MEKNEIKGGTSPFIYREGIQISHEEGPTVSPEYFERCLRTGRLGGYDTDILQALFEYGYMSSHMLQLLFNKPYRSLQSRLAKLRRNGFIIRYCFQFIIELEKTKQTVQTAFFYGLGQKVRQYYSESFAAPYLPVFSDTINVLKCLALNQFIVDCKIYDGPVVKKIEGFAVQAGSYTYKAGYAMILPSLEGGICFVPIVSRREENWPEQLIPNLKVVLSSKVPAKATMVIPVILCEDMVHVAQVRKEIEKDEKAKNLPVCYAIDVAVGGGDIFSHLLIYGGAAPDGEPIFTEVSYK